MACASRRARGGAELLRCLPAHEGKQPWHHYGAVEVTVEALTCRLRGGEALRFVVKQLKERSRCGGWVIERPGPALDPVLVQLAQPADGTGEDSHAGPSPQ